MRTLSLLKCHDCEETFVRGQRCSKHKKGVSMKHTGFSIIGTKEVPDIVEKITYRDRVLQAVSDGAFKGSDPFYHSHII